MELAEFSEVPFHCLYTCRRFLLEGDIGILSSFELVVIDHSYINLVMKSDNPVKSATNRNGLHAIEASAELGTGSREYELIEF